jgi:hypothetical protein
MDTDALIKHARSRLDHAAAQRLLKEKYQARLVFGYNGGMWQASPHMIVFLSLYGDQEVVVPDLYDTPVRLHAQTLCDIMKSKWQEQMNGWECEHQALSKQR